MKTYLPLGSAAALFLFAAALSHAADAPATWGQNCAACHGADGAGHTRAGKMVGAKDLTDATGQKLFSDDQAFAAIKTGFKDASGTVKMQPFADKLSDDEIKALVAYVRTLAK
jgi:mono/diheme cytochrome c family protein